MRPCRNTDAALNCVERKFGNTVFRQTNRSGHGTLILLLEVLLLGIVIWGVVCYLLPKLLVPSYAPGSADQPLQNKPVVRLFFTSQGPQLWMQLGTSEIVSMDLTTRKTRNIYKRKNHAIGNWSVSQNGETLLMSTDDSEVNVHRDNKLIVSEQLPNCRQMMTALSTNGLGAVRISNGISVRYWNLSVDTPMEVDFDLMVPAQKIAIDPDGNWLVVATGQAGLHVYHLKTGTQLKVLEEYTRLPKDPVFSADGKRLALIHGLSISVYDVDSGAIAWTVEIPGPDPFFSVQFSPDGNYLAASGVTTGVQIFNCSNGTLHRQINSSSTIHRIAFDLASEFLYSGSTDGLIRVWSVSSGLEVERINLYEENRKLAK